MVIRGDAVVVVCVAVGFVAGLIFWGCIWGDVVMLLIFFNIRVMFDV